MKTTFALSLFAFASFTSANVATFEDIPVNAQGRNNTNGTNVSGGISFTTISFGGFNYANTSNAYPANQDTTTPGFGNAFSPFTGRAANGDQYANSYSSGGLITLPEGQRAKSVLVTNTTYAAQSMLQGDSFSKKFGGPTGNDPDFFSVVFNSYATATTPASQPLASVEVFLGDYRFANNALDYVLNRWLQVDLSGLGDARFIRTTFRSSDVGSFGINTPVYVAIDDFTTVNVPEPTTLPLLGLGGLALLRRSRK